MPEPQAQCRPRAKARSTFRFGRVAGAAVFSSLMAVSVPSKPHPNTVPAGGASASAQNAAWTAAAPAQPKLLAKLEVGLAGPPVVSPDGSWWLLGRDGEVERFDRDDTLVWSISLAATITGASVADEQGVLYVPTARDLVFAIEPSGRVRWRFRTAYGIVGSVCWVPGQGLVFIGRDHAVYWLDRRANLMLRAAIDARISAGPTPLGNKVLLGTDDGKIVALSRLGRRQSTQLGGAVTAIVPAAMGALVLAGDRAYAVNADAKVLWSRDAVLGIGVAAARGQGQRRDLPLLLFASGRIDWLDPEGNTLVSAALKPNALTAPGVELAAIDRRAWVASESGALWDASPDAESRSTSIASAPLTRPVLDVQNARILVGSVNGGVWSVAFESGGDTVGKGTRER